MDIFWRTALHDNLTNFLYSQIRKFGIKYLCEDFGSMIPKIKGHKIIASKILAYQLCSAIAARSSSF